jgi:hypothetical protein
MRRPWTDLLLGGCLAALLGGVAACHDLELAKLRCSTSGRCPDGYACAADGQCYRNAGSGGDAAAGGGSVDGGGSGGGRVPGPPGSKKEGEACAAAEECETRSCADGVCCDTACTDACRACNLPDNVGTCVPVTRGGTPVHGACAQQAGSTCGTNGLCDGAGQCQLHDDATICREAACDKGSNMLLPEGRCDGRGSCAIAAGGFSCAPFMCHPNGKTCADGCSAPADCVLPALCVGGSCGKIGNGLACRNASQCASGFCVDGVCCNAPCTEQCMACDLVASLGTCTQVPAGNPRGARPGCAGAGTSCGGQCTPASGSACTYPGGETVCRSASCVNTATSATQSAAASCDGRGACGASATTPCGVFLCAAGGVCATTCAGDFDCAAGHICQAGNCEAKGATAAPCTATSQCAAGLTCKDGVCCESACDQPCRACNLPGQAGRCVAVASAEDSDFCPADTRTCDASGACKLKDQQACATPADCAGGVCPTFYPDADMDTYGDETATLANGKAKGFCGGAAPGGWVTSNTDCCDAGDTMKQVNPGQTGWFTAAGPCGIQFDYDCDGMMTPQFPAGGECTALACTPGFTAATACGVSADYQSCNTPTCSLPAPQQQACH